MPAKGQDWLWGWDPPRGKAWVWGAFVRLGDCGSVGIWDSRDTEEEAREAARQWHREHGPGIMERHGFCRGAYSEIIVRPR